jgi:hypothetical protein
MKFNVGKPKSGMPWKTGSKRANVLDKEAKSGLACGTFEERQRKKLELAELKAFEKGLIDGRITRKRKARTDREDRKKQKAAN